MGNLDSWVIQRGIREILPKIFDWEMAQLGHYLNRQRSTAWNQYGVICFAFLKSLLELGDVELNFLSIDESM